MFKYNNKFEWIAFLKQKQKEKKRKEKKKDMT